MNLALAVSLAAWWFLVPLAVVHIPGGHDAYFEENNLVYRRFLELMHDGVYRQINQDRTHCAEADVGRWEQAADGTLRLHSTHRALRFRALLAGPLSVVLDGQEKLDHLPSLATAIRHFLDATGDEIFEVHAVAEFGTQQLVAVSPAAETFPRADLQSLVQQIDHAADAERTGTYTFTVLKTAGSPLLLILQDAVFQPGDIASVRSAYHVAPNAAPPFYFAQVDTRVYAREVGRWQAFRFPGGTE